MKKFLIFFIIMVSLMTFVLTRPNGTTNSPAVSNSEIENYKQRLMSSGRSFSEESINKAVEIYVERQTSAQKSKSQGMPFGKALKNSIITSAIILGILFIIYQLKSAQYNELFGSHMGNGGDDKNYPLKGFMRFFFGKF